MVLPENVIGLIKINPIDAAFCIEEACYVLSAWQFSVKSFLPITMDVWCRMSLCKELSGVGWRTGLYFLYYSNMRDIQGKRWKWSENGTTGEHLFFSNHLIKPVLFQTNTTKITKISSISRQQTFFSQSLGMGADLRYCLFLVSCHIVYFLSQL